MPSSAAPDAEVWALVIYLRSLNGAGATEASTGNAENGGRIFWASCGGCHTVNGRGGPLGPDLSRITQSQSRELLTRALREPNASIPDGYKPVTIVTREGQRVRGVRKSEDAFSIQMMDESGRLRGFLKSSVRDIVHETNSLMPAFGPDRLNDSDVTDVLAFLGGEGSRVRRRKFKAEDQRTNMIRTAALVGAVLGSAVLLAQEAAPPGVTWQDLLQGYKNPSRWVTYSGDFTGQRHSPLTQITPANAHRLTAKWTFQTGVVPRRGFEGTPLAADDVLYVPGPFNNAWALDARTGRPFWNYRRQLPNDLTYGATSPVNRGFGLLGDRLFMPTADAHLLALDTRTGTVVWDAVMADYKLGYAATAAPWS